MYIKQVIIEGFKSYRDRTVVEPFDRRHNVVVGRNGSGKSNFFAAIQFVLSDEFSQLRAEERQGLLHEGIGPRVISAFVEIIFDNTDGRLPFDKTEVYLRRVIGPKKDHYFLNKTNVTRSEVMHMLESAGFSKANPYYIVKQGEINQMATATDSGRLRLLQEVAGTRVYDERTKESRVILNETQEKLEKAAELMETIEERLHALEVEKDELKEYQRWDKQRRCLEYTIYQRESDETKRKLEELKNSSEMSNAEQKNLGRMAKTAQEHISAATERWRDATAEVEIAQHELHVQREEIQQLAKKGMKLSLKIRDLREDIKHKEQVKTSAEAELPDLEERINENTKKLETINPKYEELIKEEEEVTHNLTLKEQQRKELYVKKGRKHQFNTKEERDQWIQEQLNQLAKQIRDKQAHCEEIQDKLAEDRERQQTLESKISEQIKDIEQQKKSIENLEVQCYKEIAERETVQSELKELYRQENTLEAKLSNEQEKLVHVEQNFRFLFGKQVINGRDSIRKVLDTFRTSPGPSEEVNSYCGQVIDNFTCDENVYTAVEVIAGKRLFHHIVENDAFSTKILNEMNRQKLPGDVTFMSLNRLKVSTPRYPNSGDAIPMINKLEYHAKYEKALRFIFGKTLICRNLEVATQLARQTGLDCVTIDGDLVSSKGFLTGGYYNKEKTPLRDYKTRKDIVAKICDMQSELATIKAEISRRMQTYTLQINRIQRLESLIRKVKNTYEVMEVDISGMKTELSNVQSYRIPNERSLAQCLSSLEGMEVTKQGWERELNEDISSQLLPDEQALLDSLNDEIRNLTKQSKIVFENRIKIEKEKTKLDNLLTNNLTRRRDELKQMLQEMSAQDPQRQLKLFLTQLANIEEQREKITNEIQTLNTKLESVTETLKSHSAELQKWKVQKKVVLEKIEENARSLEQFTSKSNIFEQKIAEVNEKITTLGVLPSEENYQRFITQPNKLLFKELDKTNKQLKKYSHVNKKALDQFVTFTDQRDKLVKRKEELDRGNVKIEELMAALDQQKFEAIQFTFKQVSKYFSEVFKKLVPSGNAKLIMKTANVENSNEDDNSGPLDYSGFVGIGIRVSFTGREAETNDMIRLSGGQKSLVALALIFAIQKCDPAPFYLFDEIDQALDAQHREAVAAMIHQLSSEAQFITTTFKPELLRDADKFYGVKFSNKVSHIDCVTQEEAADFVEDATDATDLVEDANNATDAQ